MPSPSLLSILGSKGQKEPRYAPIFTDRFFVGYWSNRNPLRSPLSTFYADGWHLGGTDAILSGTNVELSPRLTICRRPGNIQYSTQTIPTAPLTFYPFRLFGTNGIDVIVDTATTVYTLSPTVLTSIFSKSTGAKQANFLGIGQTLYFGDGIDTKAWQNGTTRNWGISIGLFSATIGPNTAGAGADGGGPNVWSNPGDVTGTSGYATATISLSSSITAPTSVTSNLLDATTFSFGIGLTETISGITVTCAAFYSLVSGTPSTVSFSAQLLKNGSPVGTSISIPAPTSSTTLTFGGSSNLWGTTFSPNDINQSQFGVAITANMTANFVAASVTASVQNVNIKVNGTGGPSVATTTGSLSPTTGYTYVVEYGNSASDALSSASPPSALIKPVAQGVSVTLVASTDPQVNQIWVFRTTDGGSTYLNLPNSPFPNTSGNVTDNAPDSELNILQQAAINMVNNPPPSGALDPVYYLNLVWVHSGNNVYFTRTASAIVGNTNEAFPPANVFTFPEQVIRKVPISSGLLIFTTSNIYIILGNNTSSSTLFSAPFIYGYGILSWNALCTEGSTIYFFTSDNRTIELNPSSGVTDLGFPIADQLLSLNPANVYVTYHSSTSNDVALYVGDGSTGWYRCNPFQAPDQSITGPVWSPKAAIVGGCQALVGMETSPGVHQLMLGGSSTNEAVLVRDSTYTTFTDNGTAYAANFVIGSIVLAQPGQAAICRFITCDFIRTGTSPTVSVLLGEISGTFENISGYVTNDPPYLAASTSLFNNRYYFKQTVAGGNPSPVVCRHLQIKVDFGNTDTVQNEILSCTINGAIYHER